MGSFATIKTPIPAVDPLHPIGEWNTYEIRCDGPKITLWVNGDLTGRIRGAGSSQGLLGSGSGRILDRVPEYQIEELPKPGANLSEQLAAGLDPSQSCWLVNSAASAHFPRKVAREAASLISTPSYACRTEIIQAVLAQAARKVGRLSRTFPPLPAPAGGIPTMRVMLRIAAVKSPPKRTVPAARMAAPNDAVGFAQRTTVRLRTLARSCDSTGLAAALPAENTSFPTVTPQASSRS